MHQPHEPHPGREPDQGPAEEVGQQVEITMERYWSTRRRPRVSSWPYLVAAVIMLALLVGLVMYQDSCGASVSGLLFPR